MRKRDLTFLPGGKVDIKDIVWPGEVLKPPEGVPERGFLTVTFLEVRLPSTTISQKNLQICASQKVMNLFLWISLKSPTKLSKFRLATYIHASQVFIDTSVKILLFYIY